MELKIQWQDVKADVWKEFDITDILHLSRDHAIVLFSHKVPVIVRQDDTYIVNSNLLMKQYQHNKKKVVMFADLKPSVEQFQYIGFLG